VISAAKLKNVDLVKFG